MSTNARHNLLFANQRKAFVRILNSEEKLDDLAARILEYEKTRADANQEQNWRLELIESCINCIFICAGILLFTTVIAKCHSRIYSD